MDIFLFYIDLIKKKKYNNPLELLEVIMTRIMEGSILIKNLIIWTRNKYVSFLKLGGKGSSAKCLL
jgi:hypothetical protein